LCTTIVASAFNADETGDKKELENRTTSKTNSEEKEEYNIKNLEKKSSNSGPSGPVSKGKKMLTKSTAIVQGSSTRSCMARSKIREAQ
jgi:hypothetical protein